LKTLRHLLAATALTTSIVGFSPIPAEAGNGQDFPNTKCTCQGCDSNGGDLTGQCDTVCKDKTVYAKGSEPYDYCKKDDNGSGTTK
jgi:hypothetical protein